ncbi:sensor histidine kinase [Streptomyces mirabilis]|uniref:sensor histidine kinase n=1 Tax=Streptomyces mirabilis TaxID=68239 RepID=UPI0033BE6CF8
MAVLTVVTALLGLLVLRRQLRISAPLGAALPCPGLPTTLPFRAVACSGAGDRSLTVATIVLVLEPIRNSSLARGEQRADVGGVRFVAVGKSPGPASWIGILHTRRLFALTPPQVFRTPLGNGFRLHSVQESFAMVPLGPVFLLLWYTTAERLAHLNALVIRSLLAPTAEAQLRARVAQLAASRAETVDTQAGELRRIERDLHDGAQARLVSLGMSLGLAEQLLPDDPQAVQQLLAEARASTSSALAELRDLVRGIHPPVLADRGLDGALQALALANPIPTTVVTRLPGRLPAPVESAAYFAVAEALANAIKHAQARHIQITVEFTPHPGTTAGLLTMRVSDDGRGGARPDGGTGLRGIARRLAAFDGTLTADSPPGGPTEIRMSLPCASS